MKKILTFCLCIFMFVGCKTYSLRKVLQAWQSLTTPVETKKGVVSHFDNDSAEIKEVLNNSYDLFLKGELHKSAEYYYFKEKWQKESFYQNFYKRSSLHNRNIKELGGIASKDIMVLTKSDDGKVQKHRW